MSQGFCQSVEELHERVEDTVIARGGEVFEAQAQLKGSGLHQQLASRRCCSSCRCCCRCCRCALLRLSALMQALPTALYVQRMTVALPLLWGVPPETRRLRAGIAAGGGIIEREALEWLFL